MGEMSVPGHSFHVPSENLLREQRADLGMTVSVRRPGFVIAPAPVARTSSAVAATPAAKSRLISPRFLDAAPGTAAGRAALPSSV